MSLILDIYLRIILFVDIINVIYGMILFIDWSP